MEENKKLELNEEQLSKVTGGETVPVIVQPMGYKYCAKNRKHVYPAILKA